MIRAAFIPRRMQRNRLGAPLSSTNPKRFTAAFALSVRDELQCLHSTFRAQSKRMRSPVVRTCLVDMRRH